MLGKLLEEVRSSNRAEYTSAREVLKRYNSGPFEKKVAAFKMRVKSIARYEVKNAFDSSVSVHNLGLGLLPHHSVVEWAQTYAQDLVNLKKRLVKRNSVWRGGEMRLWDLLGVYDAGLVSPVLFALVPVRSCCFHV